MHLNYCSEVIIVTNSDKDPFLLFKNNKYHKTCLKFHQRSEDEAAPEINLNRQ